MPKITRIIVSRRADTGNMVAVFVVEQGGDKVAWRLQPRLSRRRDEVDIGGCKTA